MSYPSDNPDQRGSGLILASSPTAKKTYGISNVSRSRDLPFPYPEDLVIAPPRMALYMRKNMVINNIYKKYADEQNHAVYSIDESFLDVTDSLKLFGTKNARDYMRKNMVINNIYKKYADEQNHAVYSIDESFLDVTDSLKLFGTKNARELAKMIQIDVFKQTGIYTTIGIGDNPLLAKFALDLESKKNPDMKAEWRYEDVQEKLWSVKEITDVWGIGHRTAIRLKRMGIFTMHDLAHANYYQLKQNFGVLGTQLYAHSWGVKNPDMKAEWRYEDVQEKLWSVKEITDVWGIGHRTAIRLKRMGIFTMHDLAHANYYQLKQNFGVLGTQLYAHSWGVDRSFLGQKYKVKSKSIGNSQVLNRDYTRRNEIEIVIKEMADQVATRLRRSGAKAEVISLWIGFSMGYVDRSGSRGFHQQMKVPATNSSKQIANYLLQIFDRHYKYQEIGFSMGYVDRSGSRGFHQQMKVPATNSSKQIANYLLQIFDRHYKYQDIRNVGVNCSKLVYSNALQLDLFEDPNEQVKDLKIDYVVDTIRKKFGFKSIVHANSIMEGGRAIARSSLVGGHAGGMSGLEGASYERCLRKRSLGYKRSCWFGFNEP